MTKVNNDQISAFAEIADLESSARSYPHSFPAVFTAAEGNYLIDMDGNRYLDFLTGAGVHVLGHNHPAIRSALMALDRPLLSTLDLSTRDKLEFLRTLHAMLPPEFHGDTKFHCCGPTGSDAIEAALKLASIHTGRPGVIAFSGSYHGMTQGALSVTSNCRLRRIGLRMQGPVSFAYFPRAYGGIGALSDPDAASDFALAHLEAMLSDDHSGNEKPGAVLIELVQGEGGNNVAPPRFVAGLAALCKRFGLMLIVDEIQSGMGRTGKLWSFEHYGIRPDIVCMSKGLGGGFPIALIAYRRELDAWGPGDHIGTFRGQGYAFAAGTAVLKTLRDTPILQHVQEVAAYLRNGLDKLAEKHAQIAQVRGLGLYLGVEFKSAAVGSFVQKYLFSKKIMLECGGRHNAVLRFLPPLTVTNSELDRVLEVMDEALSAHPNQASPS